MVLGKSSKTAIRLGIVNVAVVILFVLLGISPLGRQPGPMPAVVVPFFLWAMFSFVPALIGTVLGGLALSRNEPLPWAATGLLINVGYLGAFIAFVVHMWPMWMGI